MEENAVPQGSVAVPQVSKHKAYTKKPDHGNEGKMYKRK
jgi:hypothetical protein